MSRLWIHYKSQCARLVALSLQRSPGTRLAQENGAATMDGKRKVKRVGRERERKRKIEREKERTKAKVKQRKQKRTRERERERRDANLYLRPISQFSTRRNFVELLDNLTFIHKHQAERRKNLLDSH